MTKMQQEGMDKGDRHESGEREPKHDKGSDSSGERKEGLINGIGMGMADKTGRSNGGKEKGEWNGGRKEGNAYSHGKAEYKPHKY